MFDLFRRQLRTFPWAGRVPQAFSSVYEHGTILDTAIFSSYLRFIILSSGLVSPVTGRIEAMIILPTTSSVTDKTVWLQVCDQAGISAVTFCGQAMAGVVGSGFSFPLSTFALIFCLGTTSSEFSGITFDQSVFSQKLTFCGERILSTLRASAYSLYGVEGGSQFWEAVLHSLETFLMPTSKNSSDAYARISAAQKRKIPFEFLATSIRELCMETITTMSITLSELSASQLAIATSQGILLSGDLGGNSGLETFFSQELSIPVYSTSGEAQTFLSGATSISTLIRGGDV
jgi:actin-like ATPase involved in cell morphogenesis